MQKPHELGVTRGNPTAEHVSSQLDRTTTGTLLLGHLESGPVRGITGGRTHRSEAQPPSACSIPHSMPWTLKGTNQHVSVEDEDADEDLLEYSLQQWRGKQLSKGSESSGAGKQVEAEWPSERPSAQPEVQPSALP